MRSCVRCFSVLLIDARNLGVTGRLVRQRWRLGARPLPVITPRFLPLTAGWRITGHNFGVPYLWPLTGGPPAVVAGRVQVDVHF
jgi:hypothetical protein